MIVRSAELKTVCGFKSALPVTGLPEAAFAGRSNVGKSSLINSVLNRKKLARTSSEPGKTQTINYYLINEAFYLVDLPGYGYAKVSKTQREQWSRMISRYFTQPKERRAVFQLVDIRHDPTSLDIQMYHDLAGWDITPVVIATKADKLKRSQLKQHLAAVEKGLNPGGKVRVIPFSAVTKQGVEEVRDEIARALGMEAPHSEDGSSGIVLTGE